MVARQIHETEERAEFYERLRDFEHRRKSREKLTSSLILLLIVLGGIGVYWYVGYRKEQQHRAELAYAEKLNRLESERKEQEREARALREQVEKEKREKRQAEDRRQAAEQERIRAEVEQASLEKRQAAAARQKLETEKLENARLESKIRYRKACALFANGEFDFLKNLPVNSQPGKVAGEFYFLLPFLENGEIVVCKSATNGVESVYRLDGAGQATAFDAGTFLSSLEGKDYLVALENRVYFQSKRKKVHVAPISKTEVVDLGKVFFGDIDSEVKRLDLDLDELKFEIVFVPKESKKIIVADTIEYGVQYSLSVVREAIEDAFPMRKSVSLTTSAKRKKFKRTVRLWDGANIKRGVDGTTYVPRVAPAATYGRTTTYGSGWYYERDWRIENRRRHRAEYNYSQWKSLYDEAVRQEDEEQRFNERQAAAKEAMKKSAQSQAELAYAERIDRIYDTGALYFRAKIVKTDGLEEKVE